MGAASKLFIGEFCSMEGATSASSFTLNQSGDRAEVVFQAEEDMTITRLGLRIGTITNSVTWKIGLQGVTTGMRPDGTFLGGGSPASATFNPTSLGWASGDWRWVTLDNSYTATRGQLLSWVVQYESGTLGSLVVNHFGIRGGRANLAPVCFSNDNGVRGTNYSGALFGYGTSSKAYGFPWKNSGTYSYNSGSTPDEYAIAFNIPTNFCNTYTVRGVQLGSWRIANTGQSWTMKLYSGTTVLQSIQFDSDYIHDTGDYYNGEYYFDESTLSTLNAGSTYRIGFVPDNASINLNPYYTEVAAVADWDAWPMGQNFWISHRTDGGTNAWTDVTTRRFNANIILDDITAPSSGIVALQGRQSSLIRR